MDKFSNFYNILTEDFNTGIALKKKTPISLKQSVLDMNPTLVSYFGDEKIDTTTKFKPISTSVEQAPETVSDGTVSFFLSKQIVRNAKNKFEVTAGKLRNPMKANSNLTREEIIKRGTLISPKQIFFSVILEHKDVKFEFLGTEAIIQSSFNDAGYADRVQKSKDTSEKQTATIENDVKELMKENISSNDWTSSRQEAIQAIGLTTSIHDTFIELTDVLFGNSDDFDDIDVKDIVGSDKFKKIIKPILDAFETKDASEYISFFKSTANNKNFTVLDWTQIARIMLGGSYFTEDYTEITSPHLIHDSMTEFRTLTSTKDKDSKTSTVDAAVSSVPVDKLLKMLKTGTTNIRPDNGVDVIDGEDKATFYQISFKKDGDAQLGAVKAFIISKFKAMDKNEAGSEIMKESLDESVMEFVKSKISNGLKNIKNVGELVIKKITNLINNISSWSKKLISNIQSTANKNKNKYAIELFSGLLTEAEISYSELVESFNQKSKDEQVEICNKALKKLNKEIAELKTALAKIDNCDVSVDYISSLVDVAPATFQSLVGNYAIVKTLQSMASELSSKTKMIDGVVSLLTEALFGKTKFPMFIVYSADGEGKVKDPVLLKEKGEFSKDKVKLFDENLNEMMPLFYASFRENSSSVNKESVGSYIIYFYTLSDIIKTDDNIDFKLMEYRCESKNDIVIKATKEKSLSDIFV